MAERSPYRKDWTVTELRGLPADGNRYEIIDGVLHVTPSPKVVHQRAVLELLLRIGPYAKAVGLDPMVSPADLVFSDSTLVQPDLFVLPRVDGRGIQRWEDFTSLVLAVEVFSRSTHRRDRTEKRDLYQRQRVPEYWIVDIDAHVVALWRPESRVPEVMGSLLFWQPVSEFEPLLIDLVEFFDSVRDDRRSEH